MTLICISAGNNILGAVFFIAIVYMDYDAALHSRNNFPLMNQRVCIHVTYTQAGAHEEKERTPRN